MFHLAYLCYTQPIFICSHNRKPELNASYYSTEPIAMLTSKNTVVFIHQKADQQIIKAIGLDKYNTKTYINKNDPNWFPTKEDTK